MKGITRQVILVKSPDPKLFEQAIFIVREDAVNREGFGTEQILQQARQAARGYIQSGAGAGERLNCLEGLLWCTVGALAASLLWLLWLLLR